MKAVGFVIMWVAAILVADYVFQIERNSMAMLWGGLIMIIAHYLDEVL